MLGGQPTCVYSTHLQTKTYTTSVWFTDLLARQQAHQQGHLKYEEMQKYNRNPHPLKVIATAFLFEGTWHEGSLHSHQQKAMSVATNCLPAWLLTRSYNSASGLKREHPVNPSPARRSVLAGAGHEKWTRSLLWWPEAEVEYHKRALQRNFSTLGEHCSLHQHVNKSAWEGWRTKVWKHFLEANNVRVFVQTNSKAH